MNSKIVMLAVTAAISIIMVGSVLMPTINDAVDDSYITYYNDKNSQKPYSELKAGDVVRSDNMSDLYVNDELITRNNVIGENYVKTSNFILAANSLIRISSAGDSVSFVQGLTSFTLTMTDESTATIDGVNANGAFNVVFENLEWGFVATNVGDWSEPYYYYPGQIYINDLTQIYGCGPVDGTTHFYNFNGSTLRLETTVQETPIVFNLTDLGRGVFSFSPALNGDVVATTDDGVTFDVRNLIVPIKISSDPIASGVPGLLKAIPVLVILSIILGVAVFIKNRD